MTTRFRVWDGSEMHEPPHNFCITSEGVGRLDGHDAWTGSLVEHREWGALEGWVVLLCSGLTDAEGTEIYEGDIIDFRGPKVVVHGHFQDGDGCDNYGWFLADPDLATGSIASNIDCPCLTPSFARRKEVIGNRYENPQLLE